MAHPDPAAHLRSQVRTALDRAGIGQAEAARRLGVSTKHLNQMLLGRAPLTLDWAIRLLDLCGADLLIGIHLRPTTKEANRD